MEELANSISWGLSATGFQTFKEFSLDPFSLYITYELEDFLICKSLPIVTTGVVGL